jgi:hypothetical protein
VTKNLPSDSLKTAWKMMFFKIANNKFLNLLAPYLFFNLSKLPEPPLVKDFPKPGF